MRRVETSSLHRGVAGARHAFVPMPAAANKLDLLLQASRRGGLGVCRGLGAAVPPERVGACC